MNTEQKQSSSGSSLISFRLANSLMRSSKDDRRINALAILAFTVSMGIFLTVIGGFHAFVIRSQEAKTLFTNPITQEMASSYIIYAGIAIALIIAPLATLSAHAARLTLRRRDRRLSTLRLAGATQAQTTLLTIMESARQALIGSLLGCLLYLTCIPLVRLIVFQGLPFSFSQLWVGFPIMIAAVVAITLICMLSSLISLRKVNISPLGTSMRVGNPQMSKARIAVGAVLFAFVAFIFTRRAGGGQDMLGKVLIAVAGVSIIVGVINLIAPLFISLFAKLLVLHPINASWLIGLRRLIDDPKRAWRSSAGVGLAVFVCAIAAAAEVTSAGGSNKPSYDQAMQIYMLDIGTGGRLTLAFVSILASVSAMVTQSAMVYDQADQYLSLSMEGADRKVLDKARRVETVTPLLMVTIICTILGLLLLSTAGMQTMVSPTFLPSYLLMAAASVALVIFGGMASRIASRQVSARMVRQDD